MEKIWRKALIFLFNYFSLFRAGVFRTAEMAFAGGFWPVVDGGQSDPGIGQVVRGIAVRGDAGHGSVVDASDEVAYVLVSPESAGTASR